MPVKKLSEEEKAIEEAALEIARTCSTINRKILASGGKLTHFYRGGLDEPSEYYQRYEEPDKRKAFERRLKAMPR